MKLAVIGTGKIAHQVVSYLVAWGYEFAAELTRSAAYSSFKDALAGAEFDTVYITTPNNTHFSLAQAALEADKNVIVEKPMTSNFAEAQKLADLARTRDLFLYEATTTLYQPNYQAIREALPQLGAIRLVSSEYSQSARVYPGGVRWLLDGYRPICCDVDCGSFWQASASATRRYYPAWR